MTSFNLKKIRNGFEFAIFTMPLIAVIMIATGIPFIMNAFYSFMDWNGISKRSDFVGLANFIELFTEDTNAISAFIFTFRFSILHVILVNAAALLLALLLDREIKTRNALRAAFYIPQIVSLVVIGFIWKFVLTRGFEAFYEMTRLEIFQWSWLGDANLAFYSILAMSIWQSIGFFMVIYIAGLQAIPQEYMEAATIDGANGWLRFRKITIPLLMPAVTSSVFFATLGSLKVFDMILTLTNGGPGRSTMSIAYDIYLEAFVNNRYGYGTAKSLVFFIIVLIITRIQVKFFKSREVEV